MGAPLGFAGRAALAQGLSTQAPPKSQGRQISQLCSTAGQPLPYAQDLWLLSQATHSHLSSPNSSRASDLFEPRLNGSGKLATVCGGLISSQGAVLLGLPRRPFDCLSSSTAVFGLFIIQTWCVEVTVCVCVCAYLCIIQHAFCITLLSWQAHFKTRLPQPKWVSQFKYNAVSLPCQVQGIHWGDFCPLGFLCKYYRHSPCSVIPKEEMPNLCNPSWWSVRRHGVHMLSFPSVSAF